MRHGGRRPGAGRPKGSKDGTGSRAARIELTKQIAAKAAEEGIMPLEVMLTAMRDAWKKDDRDKAVAYAKEAAPYLHAKLAAVEHSSDPEHPPVYHILTGVPRSLDDDDTQANGHSAEH